MNGMLNDTSSLEQKLKTVMSELKDYLVNVNGSRKKSNLWAIKFQIEELKYVVIILVKY